MSVSDAKRLKELEISNTRLPRGVPPGIEVTREVVGNSGDRSGLMRGGGKPFFGGLSERRALTVV